MQKKRKRSVKLDADDSLEDRPEALLGDIAERLPGAGRAAIIIGGWLAVPVGDVSGGRY